MNFVNPFPAVLVVYTATDLSLLYNYRNLTILLRILCRIIQSFQIMHIYIFIGLLLPVPEVSSLNCASVTEEEILTVTCSPPDGAAEVAELLCSVDGEPLKSCSQLPSRRRRKRGERERRTQMPESQKTCISNSGVG